MIRALVIKELREIAWIAALALAAGLVYFAATIDMRPMRWFDLIAGRPPELPFVGYLFATAMGVGGGTLAVALGFRQSFWELLRGTTMFLFHRPMSRNGIILTKLATGIAVCLVCVAIPILSYAWWAATPGTHAGPFEWSMTAFTWQVWISLPLVYLAAFSSGLRQARWYGSRLFPLVTGVFLVLLLQFVPLWWVVGLPLLVLLSLMYVGIIFHDAQTQDF